MHSDDAGGGAAGSGSAREIPVGPGMGFPGAGVTLWTMRVLAGVALAVGLFMLGIEVVWMVRKGTGSVPFCSVFSWMDCTAVMTHPKWSKWMGVPVAGPGAAVYGAMTWMLWTMSGRLSESAARWRWRWLMGAAVVVLIAAGWFVYLQVGVIGRICLWCMVEHVVGSTLAVLVLVNGAAARTAGVWRAMGAGAVVGAGLIVGQLVYEPGYVRTLPGVGVVEGERYVEPIEGGEAVRLGGGAVVLSRGWHPMVGRAEAKHVLVEVVDYTCPRCRLLHEQVKAARAVLGDDFAVMVVTLPLDRACNDAVAETEERHRDACRLARIAHAVFAIDPTKFAAMHDWLFANQGADAAAAMAQAQQMVDPARLAGWLTDPRLDTIIQRDIDLAKRLGVRQLPGLLSGDHTFDDIPDDPVVLADLIRRITGASVPGERLGR